MKVGAEGAGADVLHYDVVGTNAVDYWAEDAGATAAGDAAGGGSETRRGGGGGVRTK